METKVKLFLVFFIYEMIVLTKLTFLMLLKNKMKPLKHL